MKDQQSTTVQVDRYTRFCLTAITVLLTLTVIGLWADPVIRTPRAEAGVYSDDNARTAVNEGRWGTSSAPNKIAANQRETNVKLDELIAMFASGNAKLQVVEKAKGGGGNKRVRKKR